MNKNENIKIYKYMRTYLRISRVQLVIYKTKNIRPAGPHSLLKLYNVAQQKARGSDGRSRSQDLKLVSPHNMHKEF